VREAGTKNRATPERRRAILEGALAVFLERGFERATLEAICARVGVTKGSVYHHFTSKEQIAVTLYGEAIGSLQADIASAISDASSARDIVERLVSSYLAWFERQPAVGAFVFQVMDGHALDAYAEPVRATRVAFIDALAARLEAFVGRGEVLSATARLHVALVIGPSRDFLRGWLPAPDAKAMREARRVLPPAAYESILTRKASAAKRAR
jgi:AcrR family transcriptional regulator